MDHKTEDKNTCQTENKKKDCSKHKKCFKKLIFLIIFLAIIFGLVIVPAKQLKYMKTQKYISMKKVDRGCLLAAEQNVGKYVESLRVSGQDTTGLDPQNLVANFYSTCVLAEGYELEQIEKFRNKIQEKEMRKKEDDDRMEKKDDKMEK